MRIIVTGGAGFIGSHIASALIEERHHVLVLDDLSTGTAANIPASAEFAKADIRDADAVGKIFDDFKPDAVTHQAAQTSVAVSTREPIRDAEINIIGSLNIIHQSIRHRVERFVFASTGGAIYGEVPEGELAAIDWTPVPLSPYACSKFAIESYLRSFDRNLGIRYTILRYANVYGPRQDPHGEAGVVAIFIDRLLNQRPIQINARKVEGDPGCIRDYVYVDDVVRANLVALRGEVKVPILNVCTGIATATMRLAQVIEDALGCHGEVRFAGRRSGDVEYSVLQANEAGLLAPMMPLERGIRETVQWFRSSSASRA
ncbi:MAG: NAD-dependent epimerase/dehydratase family protein [Deltaproteobacteria bacterium]|nr:NAD-dependent epimerase/dehydratase family protein [Deltaproteobacteria bacterium]